MSKPTSPTTAAALSLLFPGLGQLAAGARRRSVLVAAPAVLLIAVAAGALLGNPIDVATALIRPEVLGAIIAVVLAFGAYHLVAIADSYRVSRLRSAAPLPHPRRSAAVLSGLLVLALGIHGSIGWAGLAVNEAAGAIFVGGGLIPALGATPPPTASPSPGPLATPGPSATPEPERTPGPFATPVPVWAQDGRLNLLLIGADSGPGRSGLRTDTMILLSVDIETGRAALFGFPRNLRNVPLPPESAGAYPNGKFPEPLNALYVRADQRPDLFPGGDARGFRAVSGAIQELAGVPLDGMAGVSLAGFVRLVNAVDGLWIDVPEVVYDDYYPLENGFRHIVLYIKRGCQHMDGSRALAYGRSRHGSSDYGRMERQQLVLLALRRQLDPLAILLRFSDLVDIAKESFWTTVSREDVTDLARLAQRVDASNVQTRVFVPPEYPELLTAAAIEQIQAEIRGVFDAPDPAASPSSGASPTTTPNEEPCPAP